MAFSYLCNKKNNELLRKVIISLQKFLEESVASDQPAELLLDEGSILPITFWLIELENRRENS